MRIHWLVRVVYIALLSLYASSSYGQEALRPKMVIKELKFDCGAVEEGKVIEHAFSVLNQGNAPLEIARVRPG